MSIAPKMSFPRLAGTEAELEAMYRFLGSEYVEWQKIVAPHVEATTRRCLDAKVVRVAHDTSFLSYAGDREGLGPIAGNKRGFGVHASLAVTADEARVPLGLLALSSFVREDKPRRRTKDQKVAETLKNRATPRADKESSRWERQATEVCERLGPDVACIHVMDQEADDYAMLATLLDAGLRFVVRGTSERRLTDEKLADSLAREPYKLTREVAVGPRKKPTPGRKVRAARKASLHVRATTVTLPRPQYAQHNAPTMVLNVVQVYEPNPPEDDDPIEWTLFTNEPIESVNDLNAVIDHYRARWRIEEYFKSLKSGCSIEKRQLESYDALLCALAIFAPIAWRLLLLRSLARLDDHRPVSELFDDVQLTVINHLAKRRLLGPSSTIRDAYLAIAALGGHIKNNGEPGWMILGQGFERFVEAESTWRAALGAKK